MLKIPYAIRDFDKLIRGKFIYMDRTDRIPILEDLGYELLFLRPRRFGKSLWLSTLMNYYDVAKADDFAEIFGHLAVGKNPTPLHNQYLVMKWDFSNVESYGTIEDIRQSLYDIINEEIAIFADDYHNLLKSPVRINPENALASFHSAVAATRRTPYKLYLFIDEYDNFANEVMMGQQGDNRKRYNDLVSGEGLLKTLFKNLKSAGAGNGLDRLFITGVSPVVMNDLTSGPNVNEDITWLPQFNDLCGFREEEIRSLVGEMVDKGLLALDKVDELMGQLRLFYNGSRFITHLPGGKVQDIPKIYNPTLTFYFLRNIQRFGEYPQNMLDSNLAPDYNKLVYISGYPKGRQILSDVLDGETELTITGLDDRWGVRELLKLKQQRERLASLLCYLGALTIAEKTSAGEVKLDVPNLVMRKLYAERIMDLTFDDEDDREIGRDAARQLFLQGNIEPLCTFVEKHLLSVYNNRDYRHFNELTVKTLFMALLHYNNLYVMDSEPAIQRRYGDLIMMLRPEMRHHDVFDLLIEFKYVPLSNPNEDDRRMSGKVVQQKSRSELADLSAVKKGISDATNQLKGYRKTLELKYGESLKLRTYAVVAVGVECLIWKETL